MYKAVNHQFNTTTFESSEQLQYSSRSTQGSQ